MDPNRIVLPPYYLTLFDDPPTAVADPPAPAATPAPAAKPTAAATPAAPATAPAAQPEPEPIRIARDADGRFVPSSNTPKDVQEALDAANNVITANNKRRAEIRQEEENRVRGTIEEVSKKTALSDRRAIRAEVRSAVSRADILEADAEDDIVDLVMRHAGDTIKIDSDSGDVIGVRDAVKAFKDKKPFFFKPVTAAKPGETKPGETKPGETKPTATAAGTSPGGEGGAATTFGGLPDLRNLTREERKAAIRDHKRSMRGPRGR